MNERGEGVSHRRINGRTAAAAGMLALGLGLSGCSGEAQGPAVPRQTATKQPTPSLEPTVAPTESPSPLETAIPFPPEPTPETTPPVIVEVCDLDDGVIVAVEESIAADVAYSRNLSDCESVPEVPVPAESENTPEVINDTLAEVVTNFTDMYAPHREMGIVLFDWETGETAMHNPDKQFVSASLFKLYVAYGILQDVDAGLVDMNERLPVDPNANNDIFVPADGITVGDCLEKMITVSSNTCGSALNQRVGWAALDQKLQQAGFENTLMNPYRDGAQYVDRLTTARDVSQLYRKLYDGELLSPASSDVFITHLRNQQLGYALPTGLSPHLTIDHKPGYLPSAHGTYSHDSGVIWQNGQPTLAVLLTLDQKKQSPAVFTTFGATVSDYLAKK